MTHSMPISEKDARRIRFARRKRKHVKDIRALDYIQNQRNSVEYGSGDSHSDGATYNIMVGRNVATVPSRLINLDSLRN